MNIAILIGRLTKDPELRYIPSSGNPVATFSLAVDRTFVGKDGQKQADFFNIVVWGKQAENAANYLRKGSQVAVRGVIQNRSYETQSGEKRYRTEIIANNVQYLTKSAEAAIADGNTDSMYSPEEIDIEGYHALEEDNVPF